MNVAARGLLVLLIGVLLTFPGALVAAAQGTGVIEGVVLNGTAGAAPPADAEVVIHVLQNRVKTGEQRVRTDAAGRFQASGLATGPDLLYFPIVDYAGVSYYPDRPLTLDGSGPVQTQITVFEGTPTPEAISFERLNMLIVDVTPTALSIMEMGAAVNAADRAFVADPQATGSARTLRFLLPPGAIQVTPQAGLPPDSLESIPDGFATTDPVRPGRREIAFSYQLPYSSSSLDLTRSFALPVGTFTLYIPNEYGAVVPGGIALPGLADLGGRQYLQYAVENVVPGTEVRVRLTGLPAPLFANPRELGLLVIGIAALALGVFLAIAVRRRWKQRQAPLSALPAAAVVGEAPTTFGSTSAAVGAAPESDSAGAARLALVRAVAQLDERFAAGGLDETAYRAEREEQKARLLSLTRATAGTR